MASTINADNGIVSGSSGVKTTADTSGVLALQTNGTTAATVDASGRVLVNTISPIASAGRFQVASGDGQDPVYIQSTTASGYASVNFYNNSGTQTFGVGYANASAAVAAGTAYMYTGGATPITFFTNATERARINTSGAWSFGSSGTATGTSGQVLTSGGSGAAPSWSTLTVSGSGGATSSGITTLTSASSGAQSITTTDYGQYVKLPDATTMTKAACVFNITNAGGYPLKIKNSAGSTLGFIYPGYSSVVGLADSSTAAGVWDISNMDFVGISASKNTFLSGVSASLLQRIALDANRTLFLIGGTSGSGSTYAVVYDNSSNTWGSFTLVRSSGGSCVGYLTGTDAVLAVTCNNTTGMEARILSVSGTTITANTAATATLAVNLTTFLQIIAVGSSYVVSYFSSAGTAFQIRAMTVSGTTVSIGAATSFSGTVSYFSNFAASSSVLLTAYNSNSTFQLNTYTVSGTTITTGASSSWAISNSDNFLRIVQVGTRWVALYRNSTDTAAEGKLVSLSGTTISVGSAVTVSVNQISYQYSDAFAVGSKCVVGLSGYVNVLTDTAGTLTAGTELTGIGTGNPVCFVSYDSTYAMWAAQGATSYYSKIDISGSSPTRVETTAIYGGVSACVRFFGQPSFYNNKKAACWVKGAYNVSIGTTNTGSSVGNAKTGVLTLSGGYAYYPLLNLPGSFDGGQQMTNGYDNEVWYVDTTSLRRFEGPT